jgi:replicative DNA helicase
MEQIEIEQDDIAKHLATKLQIARESLGNRTGPNVLWMNEYEDDTQLRIHKYDLSNGIPTMAAALTDFNKGIACIAGLPNAGKTTLLINMMLGGLQNDPDLIVVDISLDDPFDKRYTQYICALTGLHYQELTTDVELSPAKQALRDKADALLDQLVAEGRLRIYEAKETITLSDGRDVKVSMRNFKNVFREMRKLRAKHPDKKFAFFIDAWNNMDTSNNGMESLNTTNAWLGSLQEEANTNEVMVFLNAHLRKTMGRKATLEDIKGTSDMAYNVVWAMILRNEYRENAFIKPLMYNESGVIYPVVVGDIVKTKVSTWDTPLLYGLKAGQCKIIPLDPSLYMLLLEEYRGNRK